MVIVDQLIIVRRQLQFSRYLGWPDETVRHWHTTLQLNKALAPRLVLPPQVVPPPREPRVVPPPGSSVKASEEVVAACDVALPRSFYPEAVPDVSVPTPLDVVKR